MKNINNVITKLFHKSFAFLEVSIVSTESNKPLSGTCEYSNVTAHLLYHATELYLKFAISSKTKKIPPKGHNIFALHDEYKKLFNHRDYDIELPFIKKIEYLGYTKEEIKNHKKNYPMPLQLQLRYPVGDNGEIYIPCTKYDTSYLLEYKKHLLDLAFLIHPALISNKN